VLVALVVFAIGLLGLATLQLDGLGHTQASMQRTIAGIAAQNIIDHLRANRTAISGGNTFYLDVETENIDSTGVADCTAAPCGPQQLANFDLLLWKTQLEAALPRANAIICIDSSPTDGNANNVRCDGTGDSMVVKIFWRERGQRGTGRDLEHIRYTVVLGTRV